MIDLIKADVQQVSSNADSAESLDYMLDLIKTAASVDDPKLLITASSLNHTSKPGHLLQELVQLLCLDNVNVVKKSLMALG